MDLMWIIYLIDTIAGNDFIISTKDYFVLTLMLLIGIAIISSFWLLIDDLDENCFKLIIKFINVKTISTWWITLLILVIIGNFLGKFIPDKETTYKMLAAYGVQQTYETVTGSEEAKSIASKSLKVVEKALDQYLQEEQELKKAKEEKTENSNE